MTNVRWSNGSIGSIGQAISLNNDNDLVYSMIKLSGWLRYCLFYTSHFTRVEYNSNNLDNGIIGMVQIALDATKMPSNV